jgi:hypothetical protein
VVDDRLAEVQKVGFLARVILGLGKVLTENSEIHGPWDPARPVIRRQWA